MAEVAIEKAKGIAPLTALSDEERMFQAAAREFAEKEVGPHVEEMDRDGVFKRDLIDKFFAQGFMGLEVPEAYGGSGGTFFMAALPLSGNSPRDAPAGGRGRRSKTPLLNHPRARGRGGRQQDALPAPGGK